MGLSLVAAMWILFLPNPSQPFVTTSTCHFPSVPLLYQIRAFRLHPCLSHTRKSCLSSSSIERKGGDNSQNVAAFQERRCLSDDAAAMPATTMDRRSVLLSSFGVGAALLFTGPDAASAGAEFDAKTGQLYVPATEMLRGFGSDAARGTVTSGSHRRKKEKDASVSSSQGLYPVAFVAYLARFLLSFDSAVRSWWKSEISRLNINVADGVGGNLGGDERERELRSLFAEFAESVEVGLADYFNGPYGSYASVSAAVAGINAAGAAGSVRIKSKKDGIRNTIFNWMMVKNRKKDSPPPAIPSKPSKKKKFDVRSGRRQGILNLYALLKARYTKREEKYQLATLFSLLSDPYYQPKSEITALLGEADDASVTSIALDFNGNGYPPFPAPEVIIDGPPALGDNYRPARATAFMRPTGKILRIDVLDGGEGYFDGPIPTVTVFDRGRGCEAAAILNRDGQVAGFEVLNGGVGYGLLTDTVGNAVPPVVEISGPRGAASWLTSSRRRTATARAVLEYEVAEVSLDEGVWGGGGNGYPTTSFPRVRIQSPSQIKGGDEFGSAATASVLSVGSVSSIPTDSFGKKEFNDYTDPAALLRVMRRDPTAVLPISAARPVWNAENGIYEVPVLTAARTEEETVSSRTKKIWRGSLPYRTEDPIFGAVGLRPVTRDALDLSTSEYGRLAASGAFCTVIVRTILNPLELVKTKIQLGNDAELNEFINEKKMEKIMPDKQFQSSAPLSSTEKINTSLEGALDQSAAKKESTELQPVSPTSTALQVTPDLTASKLSKTRPSDRSSNMDQMSSHMEKSTALKEYAGKEEGKEEKDETSVGTVEMMGAIIKLRGLSGLFQSADITFLASLAFGSLGFGATELFRRFFTKIFFDGGQSDGSTSPLLLAAALACIVTCVVGTPFEFLRVRSMARPGGAANMNTVFSEFLAEEEALQSNSSEEAKVSSESIVWTKLKKEDLLPLWGPLGTIISRELPFAIVKFAVFGAIASAVNDLLGPTGVQVGVGKLGLAASALSGAIAGVAAATISHPADLVLTLTSIGSDEDGENDDGKDENTKSIQSVVKEELNKPGGVANLFVGLSSRSTFFFLVIGLQFLLYDYLKILLGVGSEDLNLVLDVFYAIRKGLVGGE